MFFLLAWMAGRLVPEAAPRFVRTRGGSRIDDQKWLALARLGLREREELTVHQIEQHLDEAVAHARDGRTSLAEEFGNPLGYARSLPGDDLVIARRTVVIKTLLAVCLLLAVSGWEWTSSLWGSAWRGAILALVGVECVGAWRGWLGLRRAPVLTRPGHRPRADRVCG